MPAELVDKIKKARTFNQGFATGELVQAMLLDMAWHTLPPGEKQADVDAFETAALKRFNVDMPLIPPRYRTTYFAHIWGGGYTRATTPTCGARCSTTMRTPGSRSTAGSRGRTASGSAT